MRREILVSKGPPRQGTKAAARNGMALQATGPSAMEGSSGHRWAIAPQNIEQFRIVLPIFKVSAPPNLRDRQSLTHTQHGGVTSPDEDTGALHSQSALPAIS